MPKYADVKVGDTLGPLVKTMDRLRLVQYAAGSGDFNPLHYDADHAQAKAIGDNIVHGRMKYAALGELVASWLDHSGWVRSISCQYRGMDLRDQPFTARGRVTGKREEDGRKLVDLEVWVESAQGKTTTPGKATVVLNG
jgi:hypothetical protein